MRGVQLRFLLVSDSDIDESIVYSGDGTAEVVSSTPIKDLAVLAACDAVVSSVSSFSMLAVFLSRAPYLWYSQQLTPIAGDLTLWGGETAQREDSSPTTSAVQDERAGAQGRGVSFAGAALPSWLVERLVTVASLIARARDLLYYGAIPGPTMGPDHA